MKVFYKVLLSLMMGMSKILLVLKATSLQYLYNISKKKLGMEFNFCIIGSDQICSKNPKEEVGNIFAIY